MMDWAINNLVESLLILGIILLVIEIVVLGFSTFVIFFVGLAAILTSGLLYLGVIPDSLLSALLSTAVITAIGAAILWKPLKNSQNQVDKSKAKGDLVGHRFTLVENVAPQLNPIYRYSGIDWKLVSTQPLQSGTQVEVTEAEVGVFHVKSIDA